MLKVYKLKNHSTGETLTIKATSFEKAQKAYKMICDSRRDELNDHDKDELEIVSKTEHQTIVRDSGSYYIYDNQSETIIDSFVHDADYDQYANGYKILKRFVNSNNRAFVIVKTVSGYTIGIGYDITDGSWGLGRFGFKSVDEAIKALKKDYPGVREVSSLKGTKRHDQGLKTKGGKTNAKYSRY